MQRTSKMAPQTRQESKNDAVNLENDAAIMVDFLFWTPLLFALGGP